jgi:hypothetical protein
VADVNSIRGQDSVGLVLFHGYNFWIKNTPIATPKQKANQQVTKVIALLDGFDLVLLFIAVQAAVRPPI